MISLGPIGTDRSNFWDVDPETGFLPPPSLDEWLPARHLARFVKVTQQLDLSATVGDCCGSGSVPPSMLLGILARGYAKGVFLSRKLGRATYDSVAFRFTAAKGHSSHDTIDTWDIRTVGIFGN